MPASHVMTSSGQSRAISRCTAGAAVIAALFLSTACSKDSPTGTTTTVVDAPPVITTEPVAVSVTLNSAASLSVVATGDSLTYQWFKNGSAVVAGTAATLTLTAAVATDAGQYYVVIFNSLGRVTSDTVPLTVVVPSGITGYRQSGGSFSATNASYTSTTSDQSAVYVSGGDLTLVNPTISKFGNASSLAASAQTGANAAVRVDSGATLTLIDGAVAADSSGAAGLFVTGAGSGAAVFRSVITTTGASSPAVAATAGASIDIEGAQLSANSGTIVSASGASSVTVVADSQALTGSLVADASSSVSVTLQHSATLTGQVQGGSVTIDVNSRWVVTANSTLTVANVSSGITGTSITNIVGNGHTVFYTLALPGNAALGGKTYSLVGGGSLVPQ